MTTGAFPAQYSVDVALRDGSIIHVRPVRPEDRDGLTAFYAALSQRSRWFRFFSTAIDLGKQVGLAVEVDYRNAFGLVALADGALVGHAQYVRMDDERAEIAFAVGDAMQGRGLATARSLGRAGARGGDLDPAR
jgi:RimJ/RimL family protein N-acetyltransferase